MVLSNAASGYVAKISMLRDPGWAGMPDGPDGSGMPDGPDEPNLDRARMESGWAGMPDGPDGVYRMGPGWLPTAQRDN